MLLLCDSSVFVETELAVKVLDGRWFGGRVLSVQLYDQSKFNAKDFTN